MAVRGSVILIGLFFLAAQTLVLPPHGWITGDQGSKFLQARAFAAQGPLNPGIDVAARDIDPDYRHQEPKLKNRRGRLVSEFLWLLPLVSAPFFGVFGMRGLYVVPALSVIAIFLAAAALARRLGDPGGVRTAWIVLLATPVAVYGLEFWEHAPAAACVMLAALLLFPEEEPENRSVPLRFAGAGAAIAVGALLREEVVAALPALVIARTIVLPRDRMKALGVTAAWVTAGAAVVLAAAVPVNLMIYGAPLPLHMTQDAWEVAKATPYMQVRRELLVELLLPATHAAIFAAAVIAGLAAAVFQSWRERARRDGTDDGTSRALRFVVHLAAIAILLITVALPLWRLAEGVRPHDAYKVTAAAHTWPFVLAILYWPWVVSDASRAAARFLIASGLLLLAATFVLVPTAGGSQWSPRFLLAAAPLLAVVAAAATRPQGATATAGAARADVRLPVAGILLASIVMQLTGMLWVQRGKARTARLTSWIASRTAPGDVLISDVFWFPEVTATLAPTRRMLFSWSSADVPEMAAMAAARGFRTFRVVTSPQLTGYAAPPAIEVPGLPCRFVAGQPIALAELFITRYECKSP